MVIANSDQKPSHSTGKITHDLENTSQSTEEIQSDLVNASRRTEETQHGLEYASTEETKSDLEKGYPEGPSASEVMEFETIQPREPADPGSSPYGSEAPESPEDEASGRRLLLEIGRIRALSDNDEQDTEETSSTVPPRTKKDRKKIPQAAERMLTSIRDPQQPEHLLMFQGSIENQRCRILIDGGATNNFLSQKFSRAMGITTSPTPSHTVTMGDGSTQGITRQARNLPLKIDGFTDRVNLLETILGDQFDIVLGKPWLRQVNPYINWKSDILYILKRGKLITLNANDHRAHVLPDVPLPDGVELLSSMQIRKLARKQAKGGPQIMLALVHVAKEDTGEAVIRTDMSVHYDTLMKKMVVSYADTMGAPEYPNARPVEHPIDELPGSQPVSQRGYRMSEEELACLRQHLKELLEKGFIRPSCSPYGAPVLFVPKKEPGQFRMCIDWRMLNKQTIKNKYPLPRIDDLLERLHGSKYWSKLDLAQGYYQVRIREKDIHKTAFQTRYGLYEFTVLGMGLCNAPATFMRVMNDALRPYLDEFVLVYLDDILIFSKTEEEHLEHVRLVLDVLRKEKLYASPKKCEFGRTTIKFLGHTLTPKGITPEDTKVELIKNWPIPKTVSDLRSFLGLANYYRTFVKHFAHKAAPLNDLVKNGSTCKWGPTEQTAFDALKQALTSEPIIRAPNPTAPFTVHTDASDMAIGATIMQHDEQTGKEYVVAYDSRKLTDAEKKWAAHEREQLAVVHALTTWRHHLQGRKFLLITDSACVKSLPTQPTLSPRQARWVDKLAEYDFDIQHRAGPLNVVPDALSRHPSYQQEQLTSMSTGHTSEIRAQSLREEIQTAAVSDSRYQQIMQHIQRGVPSEFHLEDGLLILQGQRLYIPKSEPLRIPTDKRSP